jgi:hypothetical protein
VIIDADKREQPYLYWAKGRNEVNRDAKITLTKRGGAFDPGLITAVGVHDRAVFGTAIKRVSKKKVQVQVATHLANGPHRRRR